MNTLREAAEIALALLKDINKLSLSPGGIALPGEIDTAMDLLRAALASQTVLSNCPDSHQRQPLTDDEIDGLMALEAWEPSDTAHRPGGLPQDFTKHEVESFDDWSGWVSPDPEQYFMKCCDCGLIHEMQFKVAKYSEGDKCEFVADADLQAVFRARRTTPPQRKPLTDEEIGKIAVNSQDGISPHDDTLRFARAIERAHGIGSEE